MIGRGRSGAATPEARWRAPDAGVLRPGDVVDGYVVGEKIGEGGMGTVYMATHEPTGRVCALKKIRGELAHRADLTERFETEGKVLAQLNHPCIVTLFATGMHGGHPYMVMEWVKGRTLRDAMATRRKPFELRQALAIAVRIGSALKIAHRNGVVHRDLKPENVLLQKGGGLKVVDFGIAKLRGAASTTDRLATMATPAYAAPEQLDRGEIDGRTDVFSLAQMLVEMVTGRFAFVDPGETTPPDDVTRELKRRARPNRLIDNVPSCPESLSDLVDRALSRDRERRPDAATFVAALRGEARALGAPVEDEDDGEDEAPDAAPTAPGATNGEPAPDAGRPTLEMSPAFTAGDPLARFRRPGGQGPRGTDVMWTSAATLLAAQGKTLEQARAEGQAGARGRPASLPPPPAPAPARRPLALVPSPLTSPLPEPRADAGRIPRASIEAPIPRASLEAPTPRGALAAAPGAGASPHPTGWPACWRWCCWR
jgi:serine/threonine-protein kinase